MPTVEGQAHVLHIFREEGKHEGPGILGELQVASVYLARLWRRKPLGETMGGGTSTMVPISQVRKPQLPGITQPISEGQGFTGP